MAPSIYAALRANLERAALGSHRIKGIHLKIDEHLLKLAGVRFAMDDFGTGHSSLAQLSRLPLDQLKIDRAFITHAHERPADATIVKSTIELAHNMGLTVVAEGVESALAAHLLRALGCDLVQGELISEPLAPAQVLEFVARGVPLLT